MKDWKEQIQLEWRGFAFDSLLSQQRKKVLDKIESIRRELGQEESFDKTPREYWKEGYNSALDEIKSLINKQ